MNARENYLERMRSATQFKRFGITPEWRPDEEGDIDGFIHDEVVRQWHDPRVHYDGGVRVQWMRAAWDYARNASAQRGFRLPSLDDIKTLGALVEPKVNSPHFFRSQNVFIGKRMGMFPGDLEILMTALAVQVHNVRPEQGLSFERTPHFEGHPKLLLAQLETLETADDWYLAYEWIHPWADGNGRTGKILHNWLLERLDDPVLVRDYFGDGNP